MGVKLVSASGGSVEINPPATASNFVATMPAGTGTVVLTNVTGNVDINAAGANYLTLSTNSIEGVRLDSNRNLLVGITSVTANNSRSAFFDVQQGYQSIQHSTSNTSGNFYIGFAYNGSYIGSIAQNGTTAVAYNTSSDYRLKENIQPMTDALAKVAQLKPVTYKWKSDGSDGEGFIAHELAEVVPQCVTGEKDAVDAEGNPVYQGIDTSFLVATLTAAIQEQQAQIEALTARITALEGR